MKTNKLFFFLFAGVLGFGQTSKVSPTLQHADPNASVQVIVQFNQDPTNAQHQKVIEKGGSWRATLHSVKSGAYTMPASALADLAKDPTVVHISQDHKLAAKMDYTSTAVNAPIAWQSGWTGTGVGVAVIDSGISPSQDITDHNVLYNFNFVSTDGGANANDRYGHGMHIAGIIASNGTSSSCSNCTRSMKGIAPNANLINLRVLDSSGEASDSDVISAIEMAIQLKSTYNIRVINLSLGRPVFESYQQDPLCQAAEAAWKAGIVVVVAAGNDGRDNTMGTSGYGTINSPGNDPYVITVGAMKTLGTYERSDDLIASYSSKGPTLIDHIVKPDIVAPGNQVVSLLASGNPTLQQEATPQNLVTHGYYQNPGDKGISDRYLILSGTSMAAAVVSGAVADLLQAQPGLTPDQVKARLMKTSYKVFPQSSVATDPVTGSTYTSQYDIFTRGAGYLDLAAALASKDVSSGTALSPTATFNTSTNQVYVAFDPSSTWANSAAWGASAAWGTSAVWGAGIVNADRSLWGESAAWGASAAWGTSGVWGASTANALRSLWSDSAVWATSTTQTDGVKISILGEQ